MNENWIYKRGDLYYADLDPVVGSEQGGKRPVLVIQNGVGNQFGPTLIVAPLTSEVKRVLPVHYHAEPFRELTKPSIVLLEQIRTIDKSRVTAYIGRFSKEQMRIIDGKILKSFGISARAEKSLEDPAKKDVVSP